jgi:small multidrug resistance pump
MVYSYLLLAIVFEVAGTTALKASDGFTRPWPSVLSLVSYAAAFYLLALTMRLIPVGIVYALWSGVGIVFITLIGWIIYGQKLDGAALIGLSLILAGVVVVNLFSKSLAH